MSFVKRSEYVDLVNSVMDDETERIREEIMNIKDSEDNQKLIELIVSVINDIPACAARTAGAIIEKAGLIEFEPEDSE